MKPLPPHQQRVLEEREQLKEKLDKLHIFFTVELYKMLSNNEQSRLWRQAKYMDLYLGVLEERIAEF